MSLLQRYFDYVKKVDALSAFTADEAEKIFSTILASEQYVLREQLQDIAKKVCQLEQFNQFSYTDSEPLIHDNTLKYVSGYCLPKTVCDIKEDDKFSFTVNFGENTKNQILYFKLARLDAEVEDIIASIDKEINVLHEEALERKKYHEKRNALNVVISKARQI